jgi:pimeloyl-ACP methyl ester carboxylesterase
MIKLDDSPRVAAAYGALEVATTARWFGPEDRPLLGWWTEPLESATRSAVVVLAPIGYEYWSSHRTLRTLAETIAARNHAVLRFDYDGLGDSAGEGRDTGRVDAWLRSVRCAVEEARARGATEVTLVGLRLGASFALAEAAALGADRVVAWVPVTSGRRLTKELRLLGTPVPSAAGEAGEDIAFAGTLFSAETAAGLGRFELEKLAERPAPKVLLLARPDRPLDKLAARLRELGAATELLSLPGAETALDIPSEDATVPTELVKVIADWIGIAPASERPTAPRPPRESARMAWKDGALVEEARWFSDPPLRGVFGRPADAVDKETIVVFLNSGSEPHIGPGRAWVEYARDLNLRGYHTVRPDFSGWGESPDRGRGIGRPYDAHCVDEAIQMATALRHEGYRKVVLLGLCAGAWVAMRAALFVPLGGVIAINPQLYWHPGEPVEALISDTRKRREPIRKRDEKLNRWGLWSALDLLGLRNYAGSWLSALARGTTPVLMFYAEGDDGIVYLRTRLGRRLARVLRSKRIEVLEMKDIDHQMYRVWRRDEVLARLADYLAGLPRRAA